MDSQETKTEYEFPTVGDTLSNGAKVLAVQPKANDEYLATVLCLFNDKFVTWNFNALTGGAGNGRYFGHSQADIDALESAVDDFKDRANL